MGKRRSGRVQPDHSFTQPEPEDSDLQIELDHPEDENLIFQNENEESDGEELGHAEFIQNKLNQSDRLMASTRKGVKVASNSSVNSQFGFRGGAILSMELINFMCHSHLRVDLRENVNFIVGNNGSGKSAILTALTICLGARAKATDRGSSAESLIKEGTSEARVSLKISNASEFAFKPDLYGDSIIVERRIKRGSAGSYRLRSGDGKRVLSERKDEIEALCDHYNIQVSNPLAILTQDTAKKFLVNSTPANLYSFFMEATNLKQIMIDYNEAEARMFKMEDSMDEARSYWPQKMEEIENLEMELKALEVVRDSQRKIASLETEIAWSKVITSEKTLNGHEDSLKKAQDKLYKAENSARDCEAMLAEHIAAIKAEEEAYRQLLLQKQPLIAQKEKLKASIVNGKQKYQQLQQTSADINNDVLRRRAVLESLQTKINEELAKENDALFTETKLKLEEKEKEIVAQNRKLAEINEVKAAIGRESNELTRQLSTARSMQVELKNSISNDESHLNTARAAETNKLRAYGHTLPEAMEEINANSRSFKYKPVGPIGSYVTLKDQKWSLPLSAIIGSNLGSFITTNHEDRILLQSILRKYKCNNQIIVISAAPIDISRGVPGPNYLTALDVLEIGNDLVRKALITMAGVERVVLSENRPWAMNLIGVERPPNVDSAYTLQHRITSTANATIATALYHSPGGNPFESSKERIQLLVRQIKSKTADLAICERDLRNIQAQCDTFDAQNQQLRSEHAAVMHSVTNLKNECRELEDKLGETDKVALAEYEKERIDQNRQIDQLCNQFADHCEVLLAEKEEIERVEIEIEHLFNQEQELVEEAEGAQDRIRGMSEEKRDIDHKLAQAKIATQSALNEITTFERMVAEAKEAFFALEVEALKLGERIQTRRSVTAIENEIMKLQEFIARNASSSLDYDNLSSELQHLMAEFERSQEYVKVNTQLLETFKRSLDKRKIDWTEFRRTIAEASNSNFMGSIQSRNFLGKLEYNHTQFTLSINIQVDNIDSGNDLVAKSDIKQLSGGEKSFGTTCFLVSLWQAMGCPFICMDEFDVFMDAVNRQTVIEMLLLCQKALKCQLILITPVSVRGYLKEDDLENVHMVMMRNPDRTGNRQVQ